MFRVKAPKGRWQQQRAKPADLSTNPFIGLQEFEKFEKFERFIKFEKFERFDRFERFEKFE